MNKYLDRFIIAGIISWSLIGAILSTLLIGSLITSSFKEQEKKERFVCEVIK